MKIKVCYAEYNLLKSQTCSWHTLNYEATWCSYTADHSQYLQTTGIMRLYIFTEVKIFLMVFSALTVCSPICGYQCSGRRWCHSLWTGQCEKRIPPEHLPLPVRLHCHNKATQCHNESIQGHSETTQCHSQAMQCYIETLPCHSETVCCHCEAVQFSVAQIQLDAFIVISHSS